MDEIQFLKGATEEKQSGEKFPVPTVESAKEEARANGVVLYGDGDLSFFHSLHPRP